MDNDGTKNKNEESKNYNNNNIDKRFRLESQWNPQRTRSHK